MICNSKARSRMTLFNKKRKIRRKNHKKKRRGSIHQVIQTDLFSVIEENLNMERKNQHFYNNQ